MRMLKTLLALSVLALPASAQLARNAAFFELGGNAVVPSFNYERRVAEQWYARAGATVITSESSTGNEDTTFVIPLTASWVSNPAASHHFEAGGGVTIAAGDRQDLFDIDDDDDENFSNLFVTGIIGYRYQKPGRGFQFRAFGSPVAGAGELLPWAGVSFGYAW